MNDERSDSNGAIELMIDDIAKIAIRSGDVLDAIHITDRLDETIRAGGDRGQLQEHELTDRIVKIWGYTGQWFGRRCVVQLNFQTESETYGPFPAEEVAEISAKEPFSFAAADGDFLSVLTCSVVNVPLQDGSRTDVIATLHANGEESGDEDDIDYEDDQETEQGQE